jgi:two-component system, NarL family, sensor histidine kinase DegS
MIETSSKTIGRRVPARRVRAFVPTELPAAAPRDDRDLVRMALDLHDGPLQDLTVLGFAIGRLQRTLERVDADTSQAAHELSEVQRQLGAIETTLRVVAKNGDATPDSSTTIELIDKEVARFKTHCRATVEIRVVGDVEPATASQRIVMHRVLRESLSNVARHSGATNVRVSVVELDEAINLTVRDDGVGFEPDLVTSPDGPFQIGLAGMRHRLELLDGVFSVRSRRGGPTSVSATIKKWRPGG